MEGSGHSTSTIRILLAHEHQMMRTGLRTWFADHEPGLAIVAEASDGKSAVQLAKESKPDVVLIDVVLPVMNGIMATREIVRSLPDVRVIGFSIHDDRALIQAMEEAGAIAYFLADRDWEELPEIIRGIMNS